MNAIINNSCNSSTTATDYSVLRLRIYKKFRAEGKVPTDSELEIAMQGELEQLAARRRAELEQLQTTNKPTQLAFFDDGRHAAATRAESLRRVGSKTPRRLLILEALTQAGRYGQTRWQLSQTLGCPVSSLTSSVLDLIAANSIVETSEQRESGAGGVGAVLVLASLLEGRQQ